MHSSFAMKQSVIRNVQCRISKKMVHVVVLIMLCWWHSAGKLKLCFMRVTNLVLGFSF